MIKKGKILYSEVLMEVREEACLFTKKGENNGNRAFTTYAESF